MVARILDFTIWAAIAINCKDQYHRNSSQRWQTDGGGSVMGDSGEMHPSNVAFVVVLP